MLEWLVALRLKSLCGKPLTDVPLFKKALDDPDCPLWFKECKTFEFSSIVPDRDGTTVLTLMRQLSKSVLCFPAKEVRADVSSRALFVARFVLNILRYLELYLLLY